MIDIMDIEANCGMFHEVYSHSSYLFFLGLIELTYGDLISSSF